jgi:hypothetical protein
MIFLAVALALAIAANVLMFLAMRLLRSVQGDQGKVAAAQEEQIKALEAQRDLLLASVNPDGDPKLQPVPSTLFGKGKDASYSPNEVDVKLLSGVVVRAEAVSTPHPTQLPDFRIVSQQEFWGETDEEVEEEERADKAAEEKAELEQASGFAALMRRAKEQGWL